MKLITAIIKPFKLEEVKDALKHAELKRNEGGISDAIVKALLAGELDAYAGNRMRMHEAARKTR